MNTAIYFNLDGTLTDMRVPYPLITDRVFVELGVASEDCDRDTFKSLLFEELKSAGENPWEDAFRRYFAERRLDLSAERAAKRFVEIELEVVEPADGASRTIEELSRTCSVGILTRGVGRVQRAKIEKIGFVELLDDIAVSRELDATKADGSLFAAAEERLEADTYVYVSTHEADIRHARDARWEGRLVESVKFEDVAKLDIVREALDTG